MKRSGNFSKLLVVRIANDYGFEARMVERKALNKGFGKLITLLWDGLPAAGAEEPRSADPSDVMPDK